MSELISTAAERKGFRRQLLVTVSTFALIGSACIAHADDGDRPTIWIELGGQLERMDDAQQPFAPSFALATPRPKPETISPLSVEQPSRYSYGGEGKISFEPEGSDWMVSASVLYGRAISNKHVHQQSYPVAKEHLLAPPSYTAAVTKNVYPSGDQFMDTRVRSAESHAVVDFQAGKDVGLGMFGHKGSSVFSLGVRFAQFTSNTNIALKSDPDFAEKYIGGGLVRIPVPKAFHTYAGTLIAARSFHGVGPSLSWKASAPVAGSSQGAEIALDWGANASLLFGRQKAAIHHQSTSFYQPSGRYGGVNRTAVYHTPVHHTRAHAVTVPNVGGFAGVSFLYSNAKVSFGYRGDFFFGAMDGGINARKSETLGFYGPFASVGVGLP